MGVGVGSKICTEHGEQLEEDDNRISHAQRASAAVYSHPIIRSAKQKEGGSASTTNE
jgi:hypothetical protein